MKHSFKPVFIAAGAALATSMGSVASANADSNPFAANELASGYMVAGAEGSKGGEGACGGKAGSHADQAKGGEGASGGHEGQAKGGEGACGEGKVGNQEAASKGSGNKQGEGACGEGHHGK